MKSQSRGAHDLRHQRRDAGDEAFGSLGEQSPGGQLEQHGCSSSNGRGSLILLSEKLKVLDLIRKENNYMLRLLRINLFIKS